MVRVQEGEQTKPLHCTNNLSPSQNEGFFLTIKYYKIAFKKKPEVDSIMRLIVMKEKNTPGFYITTLIITQFKQF